MSQSFQTPLIYRTLADAVLVAHVGVVLFIVGGLVLILAGARLNWSWVRNMRFRIAHLAAIGYVVITTWCGIECGLTTLEQSLRLKAGQTSFEGDFIAHWLSRILFFEAPPWAFIAVYTAFGLLVAWTWIRVAPRRRRTAQM